MREIWLLRGLPGAGKSEFAQLLVDKLTRGELHFDPPTRVSLDIHVGNNGGEFDPRKVAAWAAEDLKAVEEAMNVYSPLIIVDNVFAAPWDMAEYRNLAKLYKYKCRSLVVENRHEGKSRHFIPPEMVSRMERRFKVKLR